VSPKFFKTPSAFRKWLESHHATAKELWVGYYKKHAGKPSITWPESVDEALCFAWIDGVRKRVDNDSYMIRFSPRKPTSIWSSINTARAKELIQAGTNAADGPEGVQGAKGKPLGHLFLRAAKR
jgi:uncharacterized protein YdeI (YjbR/CyaY-like superfamily)